MSMTVGIGPQTSTDGMQTISRVDVRSKQSRQTAVTAVAFEPPRSSLNRVEYLQVFAEANPAINMPPGLPGYNVIDSMRASIVEGELYVKTTSGDDNRSVWHSYGAFEFPAEGERTGSSLNREEYLGYYIEDHAADAVRVNGPRSYNITPYGLNGYTETAYVVEGQLYVNTSAPEANGGEGVEAWRCHGKFSFPGEGEITGMPSSMTLLELRAKTTT